MPRATINPRIIGSIRLALVAGLTLVASCASGPERLLRPGERSNTQISDSGNLYDEDGSLALVNTSSFVTITPVAGEWRANSQAVIKVDSKVSLLYSVKADIFTSDASGNPLGSVVCTGQGTCATSIKTDWVACPGNTIYGVAHFQVTAYWLFSTWTHQQNPLQSC